MVKSVFDPGLCRQDWWSLMRGWMARLDGVKRSGSGIYKTGIYKKRIREAIDEARARNEIDGKDPG